MQLASYSLDIAGFFFRVVINGTSVDGEIYKYVIDPVNGTNCPGMPEDTMVRVRPFTSCGIHVEALSRCASMQTFLEAVGSRHLLCGSLATASLSSLRSHTWMDSSFGL